ncbi:MAG: lipid-binding SYLF domain-containing protein [Alphaproteobacteria bacterium]|nr:lipid-binding SYLF domain-containing protein [Alphaproteobacteria bacterium]
MFRVVIVAALLLFPVLARAQSPQQALVDRAALTVQDMFGGPAQSDPYSWLRRARAVMVCPRVFRIGFIFGVAGGECVLLARDAAGSWSAPAFYELRTGSFGLQAGLEDSETVLMIMSERALAAVMDSQFKIGGDASITLVTLGAGAEADTTAALRADILATSQARGLYASIALNGSLLSSDTDWNRFYYGRPLAARQVVEQMQANNPGADPLRGLLTRYAGPGAAMARSYVPQPPPYPPPPAAAAMPIAPEGAPQPLMPVQQQPLPPPRR